MINTHHNNFVVQIQREDEQKDVVYLLPIALGQTLQDWEIYPASFQLLSLCTQCWPVLIIIRDNYDNRNIVIKTTGITSK